MAKDKAEVSRLVALAKEHKAGESLLDEYVHSCASSLASDANNGGLEAQVEFLLNNWGDTASKEIERIVTEEADTANS